MYIHKKSLKIVSGLPEVIKKCCYYVSVLTITMASSLIPMSEDPLILSKA